MKQEKPTQQNNFGLDKLHPKEASLIHMIRTMYRFGSIEITTADGLPKQIRKTEYTIMVDEDAENVLRNKRQLLKLIAYLQTLDE